MPYSRRLDKIHHVLVSLLRSGTDCGLLLRITGLQKYVLFARCTPRARLLPTGRLSSSFRMRTTVGQVQALYSIRVILESSVAPSVSVSTFSQKAA